jgi:hypothetical protein
MVFRELYDPDTYSPVLVSGPSTGQKEEKKILNKNTENPRSAAIDKRIEDYILKLLVREDENQVMNEFANEILLKRQINMPLSHITRKYSPLDMSEWLQPSKPGLEKRKDEVLLEMREKLRKAFDTTASLISKNEVSKDWQLIIANYLSFFPLKDWELASKLITSQNK